MNFRPLLGFYWKHGSQLEAMMAAGGSSSSGSGLVVEVVTALAPVVKKHWPALNANGLLDDAVTTLRDALATTEGAAEKTPEQRAADRAQGNS